MLSKKDSKKHYYHIDFKSSDDTEIVLDATETPLFNANSIFETLKNASDFFENGDLGFSPNKDKFDGLRLKAYKWEVRPLEVRNVKSSFFENSQNFENRNSSWTQFFSVKS